MNKKGFTLIELVVVISIIFILSSIAFMGYQRYLSQASEVKIVMEERNTKVVNAADSL